MSMTNLIGKWKLVAYEHTKPTGERVVVTEGQAGTLLYTVDGQVRVSIQRDSEKLRALSLPTDLGDIKYSGRFEVIEATQTVLHHLQEANTGREGQTLTRQFSLKGDRLELSGVGLHGLAKLTWQRE